MKRFSSFFTAPRTVTIVEKELSPPGPGQVLVQTIVSAISPGTEMLIYRGQAPADMAADEIIPSLSGSLCFPLRYGYSLVGRVAACGEGVSHDYRDALVFVFHPHESAFVAKPDELVVLPPAMDPEDAVFLPSMETAVNLIMDGGPMIGERVVVFGQGIVGLLTTSLLSRFPLSLLATLDLHEHRRILSMDEGAHLSLDPADPVALGRLAERLRAEGGIAGADLAYEISGNPAALDQAVSLTGFHGRIVAASWYGTKRADLNLGGSFHRNRIRITSSQVSTIAPELTGRWDKQRRLELAMTLVAQVKPARFITQRIPARNAAEAYDLVDAHPSRTVQVVLTY